MLLLRLFSLVTFCILGILNMSPCPRAFAGESAGESRLKNEVREMDPATFSGLKWREIGPFRGGRVLAVTGIPKDPNTYYFGSVSGGVWKTVDGGNKWTPLFDRQPISSIGSIAVAESDPRVIYVGSGEACIRGNISYGNGVYKSEDAGKTWRNIGLTDSRHIGSIIVSPSDPDLVFVAALGHAYGPNQERGIFRSTNGGRTWEKVLFKDERTGGIDVVFDPHNPDVLFAALWQVVRSPYNLESGGPGSGLYKSTDRGTTWKRLEGHGLPGGILGRIGVSVSGASGQRVYALMEAVDGGLFRSDDGGVNWSRVNDDERYRQRAWYFTHIFADPQDLETVYVLNTGLFRSTDGGKSFSLLPAPHGDHHGLWIDPANPRRLINGNDGGVTISVDGGQTWTGEENQPTAQFYHVATDNRFPYYIYGAQQDNTTIAIASRDDEGVIGRQDWYQVGGGESGYIAPDPADFNIVYAGSGGGYLSRFDKRTEQAQDISVWPLDTSGQAAAELEHRFQWTEPVIVSPHDHNVIYTAGEEVFKSTDHGMSWTAISGDLTRNDKLRQKASGGSITLDITSVEYYDTVFSLAESSVTRDLLWAGTDDGLVHVTRDGGKKWSNVTPRELPEWSMISQIDPSPQDAASAYIAVDRHKLDDFKPYIYKTADYGLSWKRINQGIPEGAYVRVVREDPVRKGLLYAGTELGVFVSFDDGANWQSLQLNLPTVPVHDLTIKDDDLIAATHGRSFWVLDDVTPLRQLTSETAEQEVFLFSPESTYRLRFPEEVDRRRPVGQNPPNGAIIDYYFKAEPREEVVLQILDTAGNVVRKYSSRKSNQHEQPPEWPDQEKPPETLPAHAGMNRFAWELRYDKPVETPGAFYSGIGPLGPLVLPGMYQVKLTVGGIARSAPLEIKRDPRVTVPDSDVRREFDLAMDIRARISELHTTINQIRKVRAEIRVSARQKGEDKVLIHSADSLEHKLASIEEKLIQVKMKSSEGNLRYPNMLNEEFDSLSHTVESADAAPTKQMYAVFGSLTGRLDEQLAVWKQINLKDVAEYNKLLVTDGISVSVSAEENSTRRR